jgi:hypothetical protein
MADGQFIINNRTESVTTPTPAAARPFGLRQSPDPVSCTPDDPFGRGGQGASFREPSPWSKTEQEMRAAQEKSEAELGEAIMGPVLKAAEWSPPGRAIKAIRQVSEIVKTLNESGATGLAGKTLADLAIKQGAKALEQQLKLPDGTGNLMGKAFKDALKLGSGGAAAPPSSLQGPAVPTPPPPTAAPQPKTNSDDNYRDGPKWYSPRRDREEQDRIQQGVDRQEQHEREDPGVMIA